jgi:hypothetical protein
LTLNCKFQKVILKNPEYNFETFTKDQISRKDISKLKILSKKPDILIINNLSEFFDKNDLEVKIANKDIMLIQAFDKNRNYSESAVLPDQQANLFMKSLPRLNKNKKKKIFLFIVVKKTIKTHKIQDSKSNI